MKGREEWVEEREPERERYGGWRTGKNSDAASVSSSESIDGGLLEMRARGDGSLFDIVIDTTSSGDEAVDIGGEEREEEDVEMAEAAEEEEDARLEARRTSPKRREVRNQGWDIEAQNPEESTPLDQQTVRGVLERRLSRLNSEMDQIIVDSMNEQYSDGWKMKSSTTVFQVVVLVSFVALLFYVTKQVFPNLNELVSQWASWASMQGDTGAAIFSLIGALVMLVPGVPGSLLCFTCGAVFPFGRALIVASFAHHLGACLAFLIARLLCRTRFEKLLLSRPTLRTMSAAAKIQQWKVTFLSRFIVMPVQIKNYLFGVLPVSFSCFFWMGYLGDAQSIVFSVYLGSVSKKVLGGGAGVDGSDSKIGGAGFGGPIGEPAWSGDSSTVISSQQAGPSVVIGVVELENGQIDLTTDLTAAWLPALSVVVAASMTTIASIIARRAYQQVLCDIKLDQAASKKRKRRRSSRLHTNRTSGSGSPGDGQQQRVIYIGGTAS